VEEIHIPSRQRWCEDRNRRILPTIRIESTMSWTVQIFINFHGRRCSRLVVARSGRSRSSVFRSSASPAFKVSELNQSGLKMKRMAILTVLTFCPTGRTRLAPRGPAPHARPASRAVSPCMSAPRTGPASCRARPTPLASCGVRRPRLAPRARACASRHRAARAALPHSATTSLHWTAANR
jgi:hypothetical protein